VSRPHDDLPERRRCAFRLLRASNRAGEPVLRKRVEKWLERNKGRFGIVQR
jgi:hypothetical protein